MRFNFIFTVIIAFAVYFGNCNNLYADNKQQSHPSMEEVQVQKIAFFTSELQLTPAEAEKFWPLYNQLWDERGKARHETMEALKNLKLALEETSEKGDAEIKKLSDIYLANYAMEAELLEEYFNKFQKIISIKKAAKIFYAEEKFRRMLIKQLRNHNSGSGHGRNK